MRTHGVPSSRMRGAIDGVLERARGEWDRSALDGAAVVLVATLDDAQVRIRATAGVAWSHAKALLDEGWTIEFRDLMDARLPWSPTGGPLVARAEPPDGVVDPPAIPEDDLPPVPSVGIDRLRETA